MYKKQFVLFTLGLAVLALALGLSIRQAVAAGEVEKEIGDVITTYFQLRYETHKTLAPNGFPSVTVTDNPDTAQWLLVEQKRQEIERTVAQTFKTQYLDYEFTLDYTSIDVSKTSAVVKLVESSTVHYSATPKEVSGMAKVQHTISLAQVDGKWKILIDQYRDDLTRAMDTATSDEILKNIQTNWDAQSVEPSIQPAVQCSDNLYKRANAKFFADAYAYTTAPVPQSVKDAFQAAYGHPYPYDWPQYYVNESPANCANFASQAIFAGTGYTNSDPDYFYPVPNDNHWYYQFAPTIVGSTSWRNVGWLYNFLTQNTGKGPCGYDSGSFTCNLSSGDVILMKTGDAWRHVVVVSSIVGDCRNPANILVDAHDTNVRRMPLSNYSMYAWYAVSITGYRK